MRKELVDLMHEAMDQHEVARDYYQSMSQKMTHSGACETFE